MRSASCSHAAFMPAGRSLRAELSGRHRPTRCSTAPIAICIAPPRRRRGRADKCKRAPAHARRGPRAIMPSVTAIVAVMMVVMVMMVVAETPAGHHDDRTAAIIAVVMVMMMVVVMIELRHLHIAFGGFGRCLLIQRLQHLCRVRDRLEQVG